MQSTADERRGRVEVQRAQELFNMLKRRQKGAYMSAYTPYRVVSVLGRDPFAAIANRTNVATLAMILSQGGLRSRAKNVLAANERRVRLRPTTPSTIHPGDVLVFTLSNARERVQRPGPSRLRRLRNGCPDRTSKARGLSLTSLAVGVAGVVEIGVGVVGHGRGGELGRGVGRVQHGWRWWWSMVKSGWCVLASFIRVTEFSNAH